MRTTPSTCRSLPLILALSCVFSLAARGVAVERIEATRATNSFKTASEARLQWHLRTLLGAYDKSGHKDSKWDGAVSNALAAYAHIRISGDTDRDFKYAMLQSSHQAIEAGSGDPMIAYFIAREDDQHARSRPTDVKPAMRAVADRLFKSGYPTVCKFNAASRAGARVKTLTGSMSEFPPEILPYREKCLKYLLELLEDKTTPPMELVDACRSFFGGLQGDDPAMETNFNSFEPAFLKNWTNAYLHHLVKGIYYRCHAWGARGSGFAGSVTGKGWDLFGQRLKLAATELEAAWKLNPEEPNIAMEMMNVQLGLGGDEAELKRWQQRAMQADPENYEACSTMLNCLSPKWGGSEEQMLSFARQCSTNFGGRVPLILDEAHETIAKVMPVAEQTAYWSKESIWKEIKPAYDRYFQTRPPGPDTGSRTRLALVAYRTRQWDAFLALVDGMNVVDVDQFRGKKQFDLCVAYCRQKVAQLKKTPDSGNGIPDK